MQTTITYERRDGNPHYKESYHYVSPDSKEPGRVDVYALRTGGIRVFATRGDWRQAKGIDLLNGDNLTPNVEPLIYPFHEALRQMPDNVRQHFGQRFDVNDAQHPLSH